MPTANVRPHTDNVSGRFRLNIRNAIKMQAKNASGYLNDATIYEVFMEEIQKLITAAENKPDEEEDEDEDDLTPVQEAEARMRREHRVRHTIAGGTV